MKTAEEVRLQELAENIEGAPSGNAPLEPRQQRGSIVASISGMIMVTFIAQVLSGAVATRTLLLGFVMGFPLLAAVWAGSRLFERLPKQNYRRATLLLLFAAGAAALLK